MPGIGAYGARQARRNAEVAAEAGCPAVMLLPPNSYRAARRDVIEHYRIVAEVGVPVVAYNNPFDTKVDLVPELLAQLYNEGHIVAVKEFTGDVRRYWELAEVAPGLDVLAGSDDVALELAIAGSPGWVSGYPNAFPKACTDLWAAAQAGTWTQPCRCTASCTRCCGGIRKPNSSRRSSCRWISSAARRRALPAAAWAVVRRRRRRSARRPRRHSPPES